jgi:hypothetical protein
MQPALKSYGGWSHTVERIFIEITSPLSASTLNTL